MRPRAPPDGRRHREHSAGWLDNVDDVPVFLLGKGENQCDSANKSFGRRQISGENNSAGESGTLTRIVRI